MSTVKSNFPLMQRSQSRGGLHVSAANRDLSEFPICPPDQRVFNIKTRCSEGSKPAEFIEKQHTVRFCCDMASIDEGLN